MESFSLLFDKQQRVQQEGLLKTLHDMKESINQEIAKQQAQLQLLLEQSKEHIIRAVSTPF